MPLDRFIRGILFPMSVLFAFSALYLSIATYTGMRNSSVSSALATVQSVEEAYALETAYPENVVYSTEERRFYQFWIVSNSGQLLDSSQPDQRLESEIWDLTGYAIDGKLLQDYEINGEPFVIAGSKSADASYWTLVALSPGMSFSTLIWLILAVLALSLASVTGLVAVRFLGVNKNLPQMQKKELVSRKLPEVGGDGSAMPIEAPVSPDLSKLHEAVLAATEDFVLVLDSNRSMIYSSLSTNVDEESKGSQPDLMFFKERHLDEEGRTRFNKWLENEPAKRSLTVDVFDAQGFSHPTKWVARSTRMKSGADIEIFVGRKIVLEEFPVAV